MISGGNRSLAALAAALHDLAHACSARAASVIDDGNGYWCGSRGGLEAAADRFYRNEIALRPEVQLKRGYKLTVARATEPDQFYVAESFASIYVVIVWFDRAFDPFTARAQLRSALPKIEALTMSLPPPFGPGAGAGAAKGSA